MQPLLNNKIRTWSLRFLILMFILSLTVVSGCRQGTPKSSNEGSNQGTNQSNNNDNKNEDKDNQSKGDDSESQSKDTQKELLTGMMDLAWQGKIINCEFPVKDTVMEDVEKKWGKADQTNWVAAAKGTYADYSGKKVTFGFNEGSQIFEVRSFDSQLKDISMDKTKAVFGAPAHDVKSNGQEIIGYTAGDEYKILLVFNLPEDTTKPSLMDHYSVFYPRGTVNMMADDPGREW